MAGASEIFSAGIISSKGSTGVGTKMLSVLLVMCLMLNKLSVSFLVLGLSLMLNVSSNSNFPGDVLTGEFCLVVGAE